jgi:hypothetical protein
MSTSPTTWLPPEPAGRAEPSVPAPPEPAMGGEPDAAQTRAPAHLSLWLSIAGAVLMVAIVVFGAGSRFAPVAGGIAFVLFLLAVYLNMPGVRDDGTFDPDALDDPPKRDG